MAFIVGILFFVVKGDVGYIVYIIRVFIEEKMQIKSRRKAFIINPKLQYSFLIFSVLMSVISISIFYFANLYLFWRFEQTGHSVGIPEGHIFYKFIADQRSLMNMILLIAAPLIIGITCFIGINLSHRVSGPIYRLTKLLEELNETNELKEVQFRKNDYFIELQDEFNKFIKNNRLK